MMQIDTVVTVTADREALKRSLSRIALVSNQTSRAVRLTMGADSIMLNSAASQNESGEDHVEATFDGPADFEIGYSADRKSVVSGQSVSVRVDIGGGRII